MSLSFCFFIQSNINSRRLFNAKAILVEEELSYEVGNKYYQILSVLIFSSRNKTIMVYINFEKN